MANFCFCDDCIDDDNLPYEGNVVEYLKLKH